MENMGENRTARVLAWVVKVGVSLRGRWKKRRPTFITGFLAIVMTGFFIYLGLADLESYSPPERSEVVRNYGLLVVASLGAALAVWRSQIANQQVEASERGLSDGRFQKGADMLGNRDFATRMGGIYTLEHVARNNPDAYYHVQVIKLLAAFARCPVDDDKIKDRIQEAKSQLNLSIRDFREDVSEAVRIIGDLNSNETPTDARPDLCHANLNNMYFEGMNFSGINFWGAWLKEAMLIDCRLTGAKLTKCDITGAVITDSDFTDSDLSFANFTGAILGSNVSGANFMGAEGLNQGQLDRAFQKPGTPPPQNIPPGLKWDEDAAMERWIERYGENPYRPIPD